MQDTVSIYSVSSSYNGEGYQTKTRTLTSGTIGQLSAASGNEVQLIESLVNAGSENIATLKLLLPYGTTIAVDNEVDTADGFTWNVIHANTTQTYIAAVEALLYRRVVNGSVVT